MQFVVVLTSSDKMSDSERRDLGLRTDSNAGESRDRADRSDSEQGSSMSWKDFFGKSLETSLF